MELLEYAAVSSTLEGVYEGVEYQLVDVIAVRSSTATNLVAARNFLPLCLSACLPKCDPAARQANLSCPPLRGTVTSPTARYPPERRYKPLADGRHSLFD